MTRWKAVLAVLFCTPAFAADATLPNRENLVVHEWGTFTSVAGPDGGPVMWAPLTGPADLPCFVIRLGSRLVKMSPGLIRMETPVLYFYTDRAATVSVGVDFPQGLITEWYPKASLVMPESVGSMSSGRIQWSKVEIRPDDTTVLPTTSAPSHYFAARETDAAMLRVGDQREKLLFYRGVGNFVPPVRPKFNANRRIEIQNSSPDPIPLVMLFENHDGKIGYRIASDVARQGTLDPPELSSNAEAVHQKLAAALEDSGLYRKEALAMVETWKDSWFEEGMRVMYILPRSEVDRLLPLSVSPAPTEVKRVFVGRVEMLSPRLRQTIETAVAKSDLPVLARFGRFLSPFETQMRNSSELIRSSAGQHTLMLAGSRIQQNLNPGACVQ